MLIDKAEIERVKRGVDLVALVEARGVALVRRGRQLVGLCPLHDDHEPSLVVDRAKQLWNCLGACREGGDAYAWVMKSEGLDFRGAHERLGGRTVEAPVTVPGDLEWLDRYAVHCHARLLSSVDAQGYVHSRGISAEAIIAFRIGYADATISRTLSPEGRAALRRIGVLTGSGRELFRGSVVFPLVDGGNRVVSLYGRHTRERRHLYLPGERRGLFNPAGAREAGEVVIVESVIDAAALWSVGLRNVLAIYGTTGLTDQIVSHLGECRVARAVVMLDADTAGREAARSVVERLSSAGIDARIVEGPAKDPAEYVASGGRVEAVRALVAGDEPGAAAGPLALPVPALSEQPDGTFLYHRDSCEYRVRGLAASGLDRMKVTVRASANGSFHIDTLDLYQARARTLFAQAASRLLGTGEARINGDLLSLIERLETARLSMRPTGDEPSDAPMTAEERDVALSYLRDPRLVDRIVEDFRACGFVGERATVLVAYLGAVSRKLSDPLSLLVVARSGAGKSALQDALCAFVPPEDTVRVTRLTGQALFYKDPESLRRKLLAIAEDEGATQAVYSLRTLASDQRLSIAATRTDPQTGKLHTEHYEVSGPVSIVITTTSADAFDEETRSRFVQLTLDESREQTRAILERQRRGRSLEGVLDRAAGEHLRRLHHNAQRLVRPLEVVNPYAEHLTYPSDRLLHRREQKKYLALIDAIALLFQHQRQIRSAERSGVEVEYVEVELADIALANDLAREVLGRSLDELAAPVRGMYREVRSLCERRSAETGSAPTEVRLSRREIRDETGWSDWQVRAYCGQLVELEYLYAVAGANGRQYLYELAFYEAGDQRGPNLAGLADTETLERRLRERPEEPRERSNAATLR